MSNHDKKKAKDGSSTFFIEPREAARLGFSIDDVLQEQDSPSVRPHSTWALWTVSILLAILMVGVGLFLQRRITRQDEQLARIHAEATTIWQRVENSGGLVILPPTPTAVNIAALEERINVVEQTLHEPPPPTPMPTATTPPTTPSAEPQYRVNAWMLPTISAENDAGTFLLANNDYWYDIPDFEVEISNENIQFKLNADESGYEVWDNANNRLGALKVQIWQDGTLFDEYDYPASDDALTEANPRRLLITWANTDFKLLPPGGYELRLVAQRELDRSPFAMIGEPQMFAIAEPMDVHVYNPTASELPTRLRTHPIWNCSEACAKTELPTNVQAVGYVVVPFVESGRPLPYTLPFSSTILPPPIMLSFSTNITTTKLDEADNPMVIPPNEPIIPDNLNNYADESGIVYVENNENARFFLVRLSGSRDYYWLGETDTLEFYYPEYRDRLLNLPQFTKQEE